MSAQPRERPADQVAGFLAVGSIAVSVIGVVEKPVRTITVALVVALIALVMSERQQRLAGIAVAVAGVAFVLGMTVSVATDRALW